MKRLSLILTALVLILCCVGCRVLPGLPEIPAPTEAPTEAPTAAPTEDPNKIRPVAVVEVFHETEEVRDSLDMETFTCTYSIPAVDVETDTARAFNQAIYDDLHKAYETAHDPENDLIWNVGYEASVYKQQVAAILTQTEYFLPYSEYGGCEWHTYYYDGARDEIMTPSSYVRSLGYVFTQFQHAAEKTDAYRELAESKYWVDDETFDWDSLELVSCIYGEEEIKLLYRCQCTYPVNGEQHTVDFTRVLTVDTEEFLGLI